MPPYIGHNFLKANTVQKTLIPFFPDSAPALPLSLGLVDNTPVRACGLYWTPPPPRKLNFKRESRPGRNLHAETNCLCRTNRGSVVPTRPGAVHSAECRPSSAASGRKHHTQRSQTAMQGFGLED